MRPWLPLVLLLAGCAAPAAPPAVDALAFAPWTLVDDGLDASEPLVVAAPDGALLVSAMPGNTDSRPYGLGEVSRLWRSDDLGASWRRLAPHEGIAGERGAGGGDSAVAVAPRTGTIYVSDLWGGNLEVSTSRDGGATWTRVPLASTVPFLDRQWMAADLEGRGYILARTLFPGAAQWVLRTDDEGASWQVVGRAWTADAQTPLGALTSNVAVHPREGSLHTLYGCSADGRRLCMTSSEDAGETWARSVVAEGAAQLGDIFPVISIAPDGTFHAAWIEGEGTQRALWHATSADGGVWQAARVPTTGSGTFVFPALAVAGGGAAIAWYGTERALDPNDARDAEGAEWHVWVAMSRHDGEWTLARASHEPVHRGTLSTVGVTAAADPPDWTLGDLLSVAIGADGNLVVAFTVGTEGESPPRAALARQTAGPRLA